MMRRRFGVCVVVVALLFGVAASPAHAGDVGSGVITGGTMQIGTVVASCTKGKTNPAPAGTGLVDPPLVPSSNNYKYLLAFPPAVGPGVPPPTFTFTGSSTNSDNGKSIVPAAGNGALQICGSITGVGGAAPMPKIGPWCIMSKGFNGKGQLDITFVAGSDISQSYNITGFTWKSKVGQVISFTAKWQKLSDDKSAKKNSWGNLLGALTTRAVPGTPGGCNTVTGAQLLSIDGTITMVSVPGNKQKTSPTIIRPNDLPGSPPGSNDNPATCKSGTPPCVVYKPKPKPTKPKGS